MINLAVWKFSVLVNNDFIVPMPEGAKILTVQTQREIPQIWALVDPRAPMRDRRFRLAGTGHPIQVAEAGNLAYVGSFQVEQETLVFHLFEIVS